VALGVSHDRRAPSVGGDDAAFRNGVDGVVSAFAVDVRLYQLQQALDRRVTKNDDVVNAAQRGDELGAFLRRKDGPAFAFQSGDRSIVVDRNNQAIGFRGCRVKIPDVADMQEIETAVRKRHRSTGRAVARDGFDKF
jgi:hypothetical protein